jgi:hypothetical protein
VLSFLSLHPYNFTYVEDTFTVHYSPFSYFDGYDLLKGQGRENILLEGPKIQNSTF